MKNLLRLIVLVIALLTLTGCAPKVPSSQPCSRIAFTYIPAENNDQMDIYSICPDGSDLKQLTNEPAYDSAPAWSPDGSQIAFVSTRSGSSQIYVMDASGEDVRQVTFDLQNDMPAWLPGGEQIAIRTTDGQGLWWWRAINLNTNQIVDLIEPSYDFFFQKQAWSPVSPEIAYKSLAEQQERNDGSSQIYIKAIDGSYDRALTDNIWANVNPVWSPYGEWLAFLSEMHGEYNKFALYVIPSDGGEARQLSEPLYWESAVYSWSPDGKQIVIGDLIIGHIMIIDVASGKSRELLSTGEGETLMEPAWQP